MSLVVRKCDVIAAGFCASGMRAWCRQNGFTADHIADGIPAELLMATGCDLARQVVEQAKKRKSSEDADGDGR